MRFAVGKNNKRIFYKKGPLRVITVIILWSFLFTMGVGNAPVGNTRVISIPAERTNGRSYGSDNPGFLNDLNVETLKLPLYLGNIGERYSGESAKTLIYIQDAHCNYYAQHKINEIIEYFNKNYEIKMVNLEGGKGKYRLSLFTDITDRRIRKEVADYFVREGMLTGAEYCAVNKPENISLWGMENTDLYLQNLSVYMESLSDKGEIDRLLGSLERTLTILKKGIFSDELIELDKMLDQYKTGELEFRDYLEYLIKTSKVCNMDLKMYPNIGLFEQLLHMEEEIDYKKANMERDELIGVFEKTFSRNELAELSKKTIEFKKEIISRKDFYEYLVVKIRSISHEISGYPELRKYIKYISLYDNVNKIKTIEEMEKCEGTLRKYFYKNKVQRDLNDMSKNYFLLRNMLKICFTKEEYKYYTENEDAFNMSHYITFAESYRHLLSGEGKLDPGIGRLDTYRLKIKNFYKYSFARDKAFVENIRFDSEGNERALMVTGGFHGDNLCRLLREKGISYVTIMPNFRDDEDYTSPYFSLLSGKVHPVEDRLGDALGFSLSLASILTEMGVEVYGKRGILLRKLHVALKSAEVDGKKGIVIQKGDMTRTVNVKGEIVRPEELRDYRLVIIEDEGIKVGAVSDIEGKIEYLSEDYEYDEMLECDEEVFLWVKTQEQLRRDNVTLDRARRKVKAQGRDKGKREPAKGLMMSVDLGAKRINSLDLKECTDMPEPNGVAIHKESGRVAIASWSEIVIYDYNTGKPKTISKEWFANMHTAQFSDDGKRASGHLIRFRYDL